MPSGMKVLLHHEEEELMFSPVPFIIISSLCSMTPKKSKKGRFSEKELSEINLEYISLHDIRSWGAMQPSMAQNDKKLVIFVM